MSTRRPTTPTASRPSEPQRPPAPGKAPSPRRESASKKAPTAAQGAPGKAPAPRTRRVPVAVAHAQTQASVWLEGARNSGFTLLVMGIMILAVVILAPGMKTFVEQRQQIAELQRSVAAAQGASQDLENEKARWSDPAYIKAQARERLFYVMPGEISYLVLDDVELTPSSDSEVSGSIQETKADWVRSLLSSIVVSGLGDQALQPAAPGDTGTTTQ